MKYLLYDVNVIRKGAEMYRERQRHIYIYMYRCRRRGRERERERDRIKRLRNLAKADEGVHNYTRKPSIIFCSTTSRGMQHLSAVAGAAVARLTAFDRIWHKAC